MKLKGVQSFSHSGKNGKKKGVKRRGKPERLEKIFFKKEGGPQKIRKQCTNESIIAAYYKGILESVEKSSSFRFAHTFFFFFAQRSNPTIL